MGWRAIECLELSCRRSREEARAATRIDYPHPRQNECWCLSLRKRQKPQSSNVPCPDSAVTSQKKTPPRTTANGDFSSTDHQISEYLSLLPFALATGYFSALSRSLSSTASSKSMPRMSAISNKWLAT